MQDRARVRARVGHYALTTAATAAAVTLLLIAGPRAQGSPQRRRPPLRQPRRSARRRLRRGAAVQGACIPSMCPDDDEGFVPIFDGKTLTGWDGDPTFWRAENGEIVGETTPEKVVKVNNFLIWRGGTVKDFELKVEFRMSGTNSGIQYRSVELPDVGKWVLKGYQADMDFTEGFVGNVHDERGRRRPARATSSCRSAARSTRIVDGPKYKAVGDDRRQHAAARRDERQRLEPVSHHRARPGDDADHQRPADGRGDRRGHQARRARRACSASRCTSGRRSRSNTGRSWTRSWESDCCSGWECTMAQIGVNAWVWTSPIDDRGARTPGADDRRHGIRPGRSADREHDRSRLRERSRIARANRLAVSVCAAMGPDRDLIHPDENIRINGMDYVRHCIDALDARRRQRRRAARIAPSGGTLAADGGRAEEGSGSARAAAARPVGVCRRSRRHDSASSR